MYRIIEYIWNSKEDYNRKKLYECDNLEEIMTRAKSFLFLSGIASIRIEEGFYDEIGEWEALKEFDDIDIEEYEKRR